MLFDHPLLRPLHRADRPARIHPRGAQACGGDRLGTRDRLVLVREAAAVTGRERLRLLLPS